MKRFFVFLIKLYQWVVSPFLGSHCRFHPTCSQYTKECIERFPIHSALWYSCKRILRCNPFSVGGNDPIPNINKESF